MNSVSKLQPADWERYRDLRLRSLREDPDAFWNTSEEEVGLKEEDWRKRLSENPTYVAVLGGEDVGAATGCPHYDRDGAAALVGMWVAPLARGRGLARALIEEVIAWAREEGFPHLFLDVADENAAAIKLYERMGFAPTGVKNHMPPPRDHISEHERALEL
jgi:ribosomal protein S18 acetylase RimI-like enzyme